MSSFSFEIPEGCSPGVKMSVTAPDGVDLLIPVPAAAKVGDVLHLTNDGGTWYVSQIVIYKKAAKEDEGDQPAVRCSSAMPEQGEPDNNTTTSSSRFSVLEREFQSNGASAPRTAGPLELGDLEMGGDSFDPTTPALLSQLIAKLGYASDATIAKKEGFAGGLNEGVWFIRDSQHQKAAGEDRLVQPRQSVLKLVKCTTSHPSIPTEAQNFLEVHRKFPCMREDVALEFPLKLLSCQGLDGDKRYDLIIMNRAPGKLLSDVIAEKLALKAHYPDQGERLMQVFERVGASLRSFHKRYENVQHGDFQPANIFYHEQTGAITLIDLGGMGDPSIKESDLDHFAVAIKLLGEYLGEQLVTSAMEHFRQGYDNEPVAMDQGSSSPLKFAGG